MACFVSSGGYGGVVRRRAQCVCGTFRKIPEGPVAAGDTVTIGYRPSKGYFRGADLHFAGGYNGWDGNDVPLMTPADVDEEGEYRVVVTVPEFAKTIDFAFSDGVVYDTNDGEFYHIPVRFQQRMTDAGDLETYDAEAEDKKVVQLSEFRASDGGAMPAVSAEKERIMHESRAKATLVAEKFGLGAIHVGQAAAVFERLDVDTVGRIPMNSAVEALQDMGFETDKDGIEGLLNDFAESERHEFQELTASDFMVAYALLETDDQGLEIL